MDSSNKFTLREVISDYLKYNFIPSVPDQMVQPCIEAILAIIEDDPDQIIKVGNEEIPAYKIYDELRLEEIYADWVSICMAY